MNEIAINITNLHKRYCLNENKQAVRYNNVFGKKRNTHEFNALTNINLEILKGELIVIIGPNGAGKSTLLKLISGVTIPTSGTIEICGKVASILEIGIGFQPDLTGYENIFLSGSLYGLSKNDIKSKLDEIINMFGFPEFLHTAVKYYSSGMYMRLAFSIIRHIEADIYLFDEILSVGDLSFQNIALSEIKKIKNNGATICLISHAANALAGIADKMLLLNKSSQAFFGTPGKALEKYQYLMSFGDPKSTLNKQFLSSSELLAIKNTLVVDEDFAFDIESVEISNKNSKESLLVDVDEIIVDCYVNYKSSQQLFLHLLIKDLQQTILTSGIASLPPQNTITHAHVSFTVPPSKLLSAYYVFDYILLRDSAVAVIYPLASTLKISSNEEQDTLGYVNLHISSNVQIV